MDLKNCSHDDHKRVAASLDCHPLSVFLHLQAAPAVALMQQGKRCDVCVRGEAQCCGARVVIQPHGAVAGLREVAQDVGSVHFGERFAQKLDELPGELQRCGGACLIFFTAIKVETPDSIKISISA